MSAFIQECADRCTERERWCPVSTMERASVVLRDGAPVAKVRVGERELARIVQRRR